MRRLPALAVSALLVAGVLAGCSSSGSDGATDTDGSTTTIAAKDGADAGHECDQGATGEVQVADVADTPSDRTMTSFDGTEIRLHWFPVDGASADEPAPTVLKGPGWSLPGDTTVEGAPMFDALSIGTLHDEGYNVLTWDPRGFGKSTGQATVDHVDAEGRDVQGLLDFVAEQPEAQLDDDGDPRVGMVGFSYGGGIQLTTAAIDCRVDAIVPGIAWHSLQSSLFKADTVKTGWANILTSTVPKDRLDPHIVSATEDGLGSGTITDENREWFIERGPGDLVEDIDIPTLFVQGTVDTLFTVDEGTTNYEILRGNDVPTAMVWFCGGHGTCLSHAGDFQTGIDATTAWLRRYLKGEDGVDTGPRLRIVDQDGTWWTADDWPIAAGEPVTATGSGTLTLGPDGGSGGTIDVPDGADDPLAGVVRSITPTKATNSVDVAIEPDADALAVGAPTLHLSYTGTIDGPGDPEQGRVFAQLVDDETGLVVGNQITPIQVILDGDTHEADVDLEIIAHHLTPGHGLTLQLVAATSAYFTPDLAGSIDVDEIEVSIPTAAPKAAQQT